MQAFERWHEESEELREWRKWFRDGGEPTSPAEWLRLWNLGRAPSLPLEKAFEWSEKSHAEWYKTLRLLYNRFAEERYSDVLDEKGQVISFEDWMAKSRAKVERERGVPSAFLTEATRLKVFRPDRAARTASRSGYQRFQDGTKEWCQGSLFLAFVIGSIWFMSTGPRFFSDTLPFSPAVICLMIGFAGTTILWAGTATPSALSAARRLWGKLEQARRRKGVGQRLRAPAKQTLARVSFLIGFCVFSGAAVLVTAYGVGRHAPSSPVAAPKPRITPSPIPPYLSLRVVDNGSSSYSLELTCEPITHETPIGTMTDPGSALCRGKRTFPWKPYLSSEYATEPVSSVIAEREANGNIRILVDYDSCLVDPSLHTCTVVPPCPGHNDFCPSPGAKS